MGKWDHLCAGCFREKGSSETCPHCGFDERSRRTPIMLPFRSTIGKQYLTGKLLGKPGGFGITYLGYDTVLNTRVAIKEFLPRDLVSRAADGVKVQLHSEEDRSVFEFSIDRFLHEARTLVRIDHPNVVRVRNYLEENGTAYIIMNYYEGMTLSEYLERNGGILSEKKALEIMMPILDGLKEVHRKGFLHRDIKPGNIYLSHEGRPILLDFGAARSAVRDQSRGLSVVLSPGFAPSEQYHRNGEQGTWTDVYGCSATLFYILTGQLPPEATERLTSNKNERIRQSLAHVSMNVRDAILGGLSVHAKDRPQTITAFESLLTGQPLPFSEQKTVAKSFETVRKEFASQSGTTPSPLRLPQTVQHEAPSKPIPKPLPASSATVPPSGSMAYKYARIEDYFPPEETLAPPKVERKWDWTSMAIFGAGILMAAVALGVWFYQANRPTQLVVSADGKGDYKKIMEAVEAASEGMKIFVEPGTYREMVILDRNVEIIARKEKGDVLIENEKGPVIHVKANAPLVKGFRIRGLNSQPQSSYALYITGGTPTFDDCQFTSKSGPVIQISGKASVPVLKRIAVTDAPADGIAFDQQAGGSMESIEVSATKGWGVVLLGGKGITMQKSKVHDTQEGGVLIENGDGTLTEVEVYATNKPGIQISRNADAQLKSVDVHDGKQNGIFISENSKAKIETSKVYKNLYAGIAIRDGSSPEITDTKVYDGEDNGIWVYENGKGKLSNVEVYGNKKHGIMVSKGGMPVLSRIRVYGSKQYGILFTDGGKGTVEDSEIYGNEKTGVVIQKNSDPYLTRTKIYDGREVGLLVTDQAKPTIEYCQIFRNALQNVHIENGGNPTIKSSAIFDGQGGGLYVTDGGKGTIENTDIYNNDKFCVGIEKQGDPSISACKIYGSRAHGVWISGGGRGTLQNNQIYGHAQYGVYINPNTAPSMVGNTISGNGQGDILDLGL